MLSKQVEFLDSRLTQALETAPAVRIPADFATRLALQAAAESPVHHGGGIASRARVGPAILRIAIAVLLLAMLLVARVPSSLTLEFTLAAEFIGLTLWLTLRPKVL